MFTFSSHTFSSHDHVETAGRLKYVAIMLPTLFRITLSGITSGSCEAATFDLGAFGAGFFSFSVSVSILGFSFLADDGWMSDKSEESADGDAGAVTLTYGKENNAHITRRIYTVEQP